METPLRGRSGGHTGAAPTVSFGWIACGRLVSFGWIAHRRLISFGWDAWKNMMELGRGGACVPARVALQGRIHRSIPRTQCVYIWHGNAATRTFGRARRHRPYGFVWVDCAWTVLFVGENGAQEPTPSGLYFCQPRVADDRRLPWVKSWRGTYAIGIVLFKINFRMEKSFANNPFAACGNDV